MELPALLKILLVFAGLLTAVRLRAPLGAALLGGGVALDLWGGTPIAEVGQHMAHSLMSPILWLLLLMTVFITEFGRAATEDHYAEALMNMARQWGGRHGRAVTLMALPAVVGLVPMPGGALFSAPLVGRAAETTQRPPAWKSSVNYWFRHLWESWWPLYPVFIVTLSIFQVDTGRYMLMQSTYTLTAILSGYWFLIRPHLTELALEATATRPGTQSARTSELLGPFGIILGSALLLPVLVKPLFPNGDPGVVRLSALLAGLIAGLGMLYRHDYCGRRLRPFKNFWSGKNISVLFLLVGVLIFKDLLEASGLLPVAAEQLNRSGIPPRIVIALLPFIAGLVTGIAVGFSGAAFPFVAGLLSVTGIPLYAGITLAFGFGYAGMMLSPVHLCFLLSREHFSAPLTESYRQLIPLCAGIILTSLVLHAGLSWAGW